MSRRIKKRKMDFFTISRFIIVQAIVELGNPREQIEPFLDACNSPSGEISAFEHAS